jgi:hypothetical protein
MKATREIITSIEAAAQETRFTPSIGRIVASATPGEIWVTVAGTEPRRARLLAGLNRVELAKRHNEGREVLVVFEDGDPRKPIVVGVMEEPLESLVELDVSARKLQGEKLDAHIDGKRVVIEADEEIELKCGQGSITIRKDGKIVVKGTNLLSRSSGPNRIKGGSISLN